eukprot:TRINITY_DN5573_c1_g3_i1.p1 TRINITY_DN5573_c1_g3~~TRINITY_DN5573_c1_g3_i1.p1  ORF type:complete len:835 (+),score=84.71 TRINITY_DN5573_c1_g3_i1:62-2566(+)
MVSCRGPLPWAVGIAAVVCCAAPRVGAENVPATESELMMMQNESGAYLAVWNHGDRAALSELTFYGSLAAAVGGVSLSTARVGFIKSIACVPGDDGAWDSWQFHPTGVALGEYGPAAGNLGLLLGSCVLVSAAVAAWKKATGCSWGAASSLLRVPGVLVFPFWFLLPGTALSAARLAFNGDGAAPWMGYLTLLALCLAVVMLRRKVMSRVHFYARAVEDPMLAGASEQMNGMERRLMDAGGVGTSFDGEVFVARPYSGWRRALYTAAYGGDVWLTWDTDVEPTFVMQHGALFTRIAPGKLWFIDADLYAALLMSVLAAYTPAEETGCYTRAVALTLLCAAALLTVAVGQPYLAPMDNFCAAVAAAAVLVASIAGTISLFSKSDGPRATHRVAYHALQASVWMVVLWSAARCTAWLLDVMWLSRRGTLHEAMAWEEYVERKNDELHQLERVDLNVGDERVLMCGDWGATVASEDDSSSDASISPEHLSLCDRAVLRCGPEPPTLNIERASFSAQGASVRKSRLALDGTPQRVLTLSSPARRKDAARPPRLEATSSQDDPAAAGARLGTSGCPLPPHGSPLRRISELPASAARQRGSQLLSVRPRKGRVSPSSDVSEAEGSEGGAPQKTSLFACAAMPRPRVLGQEYAVDRPPVPKPSLSFRSDNADPLTTSPIWDGIRDPFRPRSLLAAGALPPKTAPAVATPVSHQLPGLNRLLDTKVAMTPDAAPLGDDARGCDGDASHPCKPEIWSGTLLKPRSRSLAASRAPPPPLAPLLAPGRNALGCLLSDLSSPTRGSCLRYPSAPTVRSLQAKDAAAESTVANRNMSSLPAPCILRQ